jgi:hypothetical protein
MNEKEKLGWGIMVGIILWIVGPFILVKIFGESVFIILLTMAGWVVLFTLTVKFMALFKKGKDK